MVLGGLVAVALFVALIGPYFINWNDYKGTFEAEAEKILGQPVRVVGTASATLLPLPSLSFTQVQVGDTEGAPMMTVDKFDVTIELMPLLEGEIRVVSLKLDKPHIKISVDDSGTVDWLLRSEASKALNPEKVVLEDAEIVDGSVDYLDGSSGIRLAFDHINASLQATTMTGPWKITGSYQQAGAPFQFDISTGKWAQDAIRVKTTLDPANLPFTLSADGAIGSGKGGLSYSGTYALSQVVAATGEDGRPAGDGWHSEGAFNLSRDRLVIPKAVVSQGPPDRPASLAGSLVLSLGRQAKFTASVTARQLDLDRTLGKGPSAPVNVSLAVQSFVTWLSDIPVPPVPGNISFSVPAIVVGGAIVQDVSFEASPETGGWQIDGFHAQLPGQATLDAAGTLTTGDPARVGFGGQVHLAVAQPVSFASWWRGTRDLGAGRLLAPFDLAGRARIEVGRVAVDSMQVKIGDERIAGSFAWSGNSSGGGRRLLETDLKASRLDFTQIKALTELIIGQDLADTQVLADSYAVSVAADEISVGDVTMHDVTADAGFVDGTLKVNGILIGDIGGTRVSVTRGEVQDIFANPRGQLEAHLNAADVTGLAHFLDRLLPNSAVTDWLDRAAPALSPAAIDAKIEAPARDGGSDVRVVLHGSANATTFDAGLDLKGSLSTWQAGDVTLTASLSSYDAMSLARQTGLDPAEVGQAGSAKLDFSAKGVPALGLDAKLSGNFAGLEFGADGDLVATSDQVPGFKGSFRLKAPDIAPLLAMARLVVPGLTGATSLALEGKLATAGGTADIEWQNGSIAGRLLGGRMTLIAGEATPRLDGEVLIDSVDFGWLTSLAVGYPMLPVPGDQPWPDAAFDEPTFGGLSGTIAFDAGRMTVAEGYDVAKAKLSLGLAPDRTELNLIAGEVAGGTVTGGLTIHNVGGNANLTGRLGLNGVNIEAVAWERGGRPVVTGTMDMASTFEATGRSLAGLVSSLTGSGTMAIHNGTARYINPAAASLVLKATDVGQQLSDQALADQFATYMDGGTLAFGEVSGDFSIAAGTARLKSLAIDAAGTKSTGSAAVTLPALAVDSSWTMTFDPGETPVEGASPQVGIIFRGPLAEPVRSFDLLPLASYINIRQEARLQEILSTQEAVRLEKERFTRERRKLKEDADRTEREARAAAALRATMLATLATFHDGREELQEKRAAEQIARARTAAAEVAKALAEKAVGEQAEAEAAAQKAAAALDVAKEAAADAIQEVADRQAAEQVANAAVIKASGDAVAAKAAVEAAAGRVAAMQKALAAARQVATDKARALAEAQAAAERALAETTDAEAAAKMAGGSAVDAAGRVKEAKKAVEAKLALAVAVRKEADKLAKLADVAADEASDASARKAEAERDQSAAMAGVAEADKAAADAVATREAAAKAASDAAARVAEANAAVSEAEKIASAAAAEADAASEAAEKAAGMLARAKEQEQAAHAGVAAKAAAAAEATKEAETAETATASAESAAKAARDRAEALAGEASAAARLAREAADKADAAKVRLDAAASDAAAKKERATAAAATAAEATRIAAAAKRAAEDAAGDVAKAEALAADLQKDAEVKQAAVALISTDESEALTEAQKESMQASMAAAEGRAKAARLRQDADAAAADATTKAEAALAAEALVAAPQAEAEAAEQAAAEAKAAHDTLAGEAERARAEAAAKEKARAEAEEAAATASRAVADAVAVAAAARSRVSEAVAAASAAEALVPPAVAVVAKVTGDKAEADKIAAARQEASAAASDRVEAAKAKAAQAAKVRSEADIAAKAAAVKAADAGADKEKAAKVQAEADAAVEEAARAYDAAVEAASRAKVAAEKAAADLKAAEGAVEAAKATVAQAQAVVDGASVGEASARERVAKARAAAEEAAVAVKMAADAKDAADAAVEDAAGKADDASADATAATRAANDAEAAEAAARQAAEQARNDRETAEKAVAAADKAVADAEAAAQAARETADQKTKMAEAAVEAAEAAAEAVGATLALKLPRPASDDAADAGAGDAAGAEPEEPQPVAGPALVPEPPMPPRRPTPAPKGVKKAPAPALTPLNIVPEGAQ